MKFWVLPSCRYLTGLLLLTLTSGCFLFKPSVTIDVQGHADINNGIPFHLLVRAVTTDQFRSESYAQVARLAAQADKSVLRSEVIYAPGSRPYKLSLKLPPPKDASLGLYFLFTAPNGNWRMLLDPPLPRVQHVVLGVASIQSSSGE